MYFSFYFNLKIVRFFCRTLVHKTCEVRQTMAISKAVSWNANKLVCTVLLCTLSTLAHVRTERC